MGLFDITLADSPQASTLGALATALSNSCAWQNLCEQPTAAEALTKIVQGPDEKPWDGGEFTIQQMQERFCVAQIFAPGESEETHTETGNMGATPYRSGDMVLAIRRYIRQSEENNPDLYSYLIAARDLIAKELMEYANQSFAPRISNMIGTNPMYSSPSQEVAQGKYAHWMYAIRWGDIEEN